MSFVSVRFLIFIIVFLAAYKLTERKRTVQNWVIVLGNYVFYSMAGIRFALILLGISIFTWLISGFLYEKKSKALMVTGIIVNASVLVFFKYFGLIVPADSLKIIMPLGISLYSFEAISYIVDSYRGKLEKKYSLPEALIYLGFFPTITSGPIMKSYEFLPQIGRERAITKERLETGIWRIALGAFMKVAMADRLSVAVNAIYASPSAYSGMTLLWTTVTYSLQLYFDFAGYTHMAIGIAYILGFDIKENFNLPFIAASVPEIWRRWHMSLTAWMTEYVYIPLGGSRKGKLATYRNIMVVMLLSGAWHGSTLNYLVWGGGYGIAMILSRMFRDLNIPVKENKIIRSLKMIVTYAVFNLLLIPFMWTDLRNAWLVFTRIVTNKPGISYFYVYTAVYGLVLLAVEIYALVKNDGNYPLKPIALSTFKGKLVLVMLVLLTGMFAYFGNSAFIYGAMF